MGEIIEKLDSTEILGCRVHSVDMDGVLEAVREFVNNRHTHQVVTADASALVIAQQDPEYMEIVNTADLVSPDGVGVLFGSKFTTKKLMERVSGVDICHKILEMAAEDGFSVFFFGAAPGVAEKAATKMMQQYPGLVVSGTRNGFFDDAADTDAIVEQIKSSGAKVLFVALGIPKQEKWIKRNIDRLGVGVAIGVGGTFDVMSGNIKRAPKWYQKHGLEWFYRLTRDRHKIKKVMLLPKFVTMVIADKYFGRNRK